MVAAAAAEKEGDRCSNLKLLQDMPTSRSPISRPGALPSATCSSLPIVSSIIRKTMSSPRNVGPRSSNPSRHIIPLPMPAAWDRRAHILSSTARLYIKSRLSAARVDL